MILYEGCNFVYFKRIDAILTYNMSQNTRYCAFSSKNFIVLLYMGSPKNKFRSLGVNLKLVQDFPIKFEIFVCLSMNLFFLQCPQRGRPNIKREHYLIKERLVPIWSKLFILNILQKCKYISQITLGWGMIIWSIHY